MQNKVIKVDFGGMPPMRSKDINKQAFLEYVVMARKASEEHLEFIRNNQDSCYDETDIAREHGYQEMASLVEYWINRVF